MRRQGAHVPRVLERRHCSEALERVPDVADDVAGQRVRCRQIRRHRIDVDDGDVLADPVFVVELDRVVADRKDEIDRLAELRDDVAPGAADDADEVPARLGHVALGHHGADGRQPVRFEERPQRIRRARAVHREADGDERKTRRSQRSRRAIERPFMSSRLFVISRLTTVLRLTVPLRLTMFPRLTMPLRLLLGDVFREIEVHGPRLFRLRDANRLPHRLVGACRLEFRGPLRQGREDRLVVDLHLDRAAAPLAAHLPGEGEHRDAIEEGVADAGGHVRRAGAERGRAGAGPAGQSRRDVGHESRRGLVGDQHELDAARPHRLDEAHVLAAGVTERVPNPGPLERTNDDVSSGRHTGRSYAQSSVKCDIPGCL